MPLLCILLLFFLRLWILDIQLLGLKVEKRFLKPNFSSGSFCTPMHRQDLWKWTSFKKTRLLYQTSFLKKLCDLSILLWKHATVPHCNREIVILIHLLGRCMVGADQRKYLFTIRCQLMNFVSLKVPPLKLWLTHLSSLKFWAFSMHCRMYHD